MPVAHKVEHKHPYKEQRVLNVILSNDEIQIVPIIEG